MHFTPQTDRILLLGTARWQVTLSRNWQVTHVASGKRARSLGSQQSFSLIIVDAVSMYTTGERICRRMRQCFPNCKLILIASEPSAPNPQVADIILYPPLTARQLNGLVSRILRDDPLDTIRCGPFVMNRTARILHAHGQSVQLNPKLARLIELFMTHPNQTLSRATIMQRVWKTDYLGDTRTLYVHIRHARKILENNPATPKYLKTIRGIGYQLAIAGEKEEKAKTRQPVPDPDIADSI